MREDDLDFAADCTAAEGWQTETREEFEAYILHDPEGCLVAEYEGRRAGVCVATAYGDRGFLGEMIIGRGMRGRALGPELFRRAFAYLERRGCRSVSLDAVPRAAPFYEISGFRELTGSRRLRGRLQGCASARVRPMTEADLSAVAAVDRAAFGADRGFFLRRRLALYPELSKVFVRDGRIAGYVFGRRRPEFLWAGPLGAESEEAAADLLLGIGGEGRDRDIYLGALESNARALALFQSIGLRESKAPSRRMVWGDPERAVGLDGRLFAIGTAAKG